jgi:hypothetical protein
MNNDPIVEEIHEIRAKLLAECEGDLDKLLDRYRMSEGQDRDRLVTFEDVPREPDRTLDASA